MRAFYLTAALALTAAATPAMAQKADWRTVDEFGSGDKRSLFMVDAGSLRKTSNGLREITVSSFFSVQRSLGENLPYDSIRVSYRIDCDALTAQTFQSVAYLGDKSILSSDTLTPMATYAPNTILGLIAPSVCNGDLSKFPKIKAAAPHLEGMANFGL